jgi:uncharacterized protein (TIGR03382 family)
VTGLPVGLQASFDRTSLTPGASTVTLTLTASRVAAAIGPTTFTISGTSTGQPLGHTATAQVEIDAAPKSQGGCTSSGDAGASPAPIVLLAGLLLLRRRTSRAQSGR